MRYIRRETVECIGQRVTAHQHIIQLETVSIAEPLQNRQHAQKPLMLSTVGVRERGMEVRYREGSREGRRDGRWKEGGRKERREREGKR